MKIHELPGDPGRRQKRKRVGRGVGSGNGKTCGKGHKGHQARAGKGIHGPSHRFEGGQTPLTKRVPKRGFTKPNRIEYQVINLGALDKFEDGATVDLAALKAAGVVASATKPVKLLGKGEVSKKLTVKIARASRSAAEAVEKAGGSIEATIGQDRAAKRREIMAALEAKRQAAPKEGDKN